MATGALDANGIWQYGEDDSEPTFSGLLNKLASSTSDTVTRLENFTGFTGTLPVARGGTNATTVAAAQDSLLVGLVNMVPSTVQQSGGSASVNAQGSVTFTGVNSISLNNIFTSAYNHYRILLFSTTSAAVNIHMRLRASGTDKNDNTYDWVRQYVEVGSGPTKESALGDNLARISYSQVNDRQYSSIEIGYPQSSAANTHGYYDTSHQGGSTGRFTGAFRQYNFQSFDGVTLFPATGTFTGVVACYGYNI